MYPNKLKVRAAEKSQAYDARRGISAKKILIQEKTIQSIPFQPNLIRCSAALELLIEINTTENVC